MCLQKGVVWNESKIIKCNNQTNIWQHYFTDKNGVNFSRKKIWLILFLIVLGDAS